jgi:hypothetical protein
MIVDVTTRRGRERVREVFTGRKVASLSQEERDRAHRAGYEPDGDWLIGRDPRAMGRGELEAMGHSAMSPMEAIRAKCLECAGSSDEVGKYVAMACPSWPFRTGKNPWREVSEGRREAGRRLAAERVAKSSEPRSDLRSSEGAAGAGTRYLTAKQPRLSHRRSMPNDAA